jgi:hypothetical protein
MVCKFPALAHYSHLKLFCDSCLHCLRQVTAGKPARLVRSHNASLPMPLMIAPATECGLNLINMNIRLYTNSSFSSILSRGYSQILSLIFADNQDVIFCDHLCSDLRNSAFADRSLLRQTKVCEKLVEVKQRIIILINLKSPDLLSELLFCDSCLHMFRQASRRD